MSYLNELKQLVDINSYTKNKDGVDKVGDLFGSWLKSLNMKECIYERAIIGNHRLYSFPVDHKAKRLLLLGHLDTVFPPDTFENFSQDDLWVYGPGVCDMKGGLIVALKSLQKLYDDNIEVCNIDFLLVSDEETGSDDSKFLSQELASNYDYCLVFEAAGEAMEVVVGRKGVGTFTIDIKGLAKHAGNHYIDGVDANLEASYKLQRLAALTDLSKNTTVNVGKISGGIGANTISPYASLLFELRYDRVEEKERVLSAIEEIVNTSYIQGTSAKLSGGIQRDVMQTSDNVLEFVKAIEVITGQALKTEKRGGVSDANILSANGVITLDGLGPFGDGDHTEHERALISSFDLRIDLTSSILKYFTINKGVYNVSI
ncbi:M20 family metallopeptidase [Sulfurimonas sp.]|jgi:glutamate carboxypeptidase|uniref:M20 family metallopeptidase n=1 Tax=Sulfurimonas sp. TaxID=2022749 RepID=UPI0025D5E191|nr:M20 family metallopeptidase [Sulfurimonas sp.]MBT5934160.1 M20 family metallopeptidase [Sulfurimonas sp.]